MPAIKPVRFMELSSNGLHFSNHLSYGGMQGYLKGVVSTVV